MRSELIPCSLNVPAPPVVERSKIVFPSLQKNLGTTKQFVKVIEKDRNCFRYNYIKFPGLPIQKLNTGVFDEPQDRKLMNDADFCNFINPAELCAWNVFKNVVKFF